MPTTDQVNLSSYNSIYGSKRTFLRYPADWVIRFHNIYMRSNIPTGRILDFGCGSGNNAKFFQDLGYEVHGTEITDAALPLIEANLGSLERIQILPQTVTRLPYPDAHFDLILSNQVLYYLASKERIRDVCCEFSRVLKPNGVVFLTMMGARNYYVRDGHAQLVQPDVYELRIDDGHRLAGFHQVFYVIRDEAHLKDVFSEFDCLTTGYFDQSMFDLKGNFHWIYCGKKRAPSRHAGDAG